MADHIDTGAPAFPMPGVSQNTSTGETITHQSYDCGMSLRDFFAAKSMAAQLTVAALPVEKILPSDNGCAVIARDAYRMADAMLKARAAQ